MSPDNDAPQPSLFEIDQPEVFSPFFVNQNTEIMSYLRALQERQSIVTIYLDDGRYFFQSLILAVDAAKEHLLVDGANMLAIEQHVEAAKTVTLTANLDKVKIQARLPAHDLTVANNGTALSAPIPTSILRLQRREYFRLDTPQANALSCQLVATLRDGSSQVLTLPLLNISGNGVSLTAPPTYAESFSLGTIFPDCRLLIPGEGAFLVNLCVREAQASDDQNGQPNLRIGCAFHALAPSPLAQIQRYITRQERERKARDSGLI